MPGGESAAGRIRVVGGDITTLEVDATEEIDSVLMVGFGDDTLSALNRALSGCRSTGSAS